jgi:hypothetical protein
MHRTHDSNTLDITIKRRICWVDSHTKDAERDIDLELFCWWLHVINAARQDKKFQTINSGIHIKIKHQLTIDFAIVIDLGRLI